MFPPRSVEKPKDRSRLRKFLGKEYFILKRRLKWTFGKTDFAKIDSSITFENSIIKHKSFLLRPLKNVDMYLQHNKVTNLQLAIGHIHNVVIKPGQTFSIWKMVGRPTKSKGYLDGLMLSNGQIGKDTAVCLKTHHFSKFLINLLIYFRFTPL